MQTTLIIISGLVFLVGLVSVAPEPKIPEKVERKCTYMEQECILERKEYIPEKYLGKFKQHHYGTFEDCYDPEKYITYWDCGQYGSLICTSRFVFQQAKTKSILILEDNGLGIRIAGVK